MNMDLWKKWDGKHETDDQRRRLDSAKKANMTPKSIDHESGTGEFAGSANYITTLEDCTCMDFKKRRLPCKHMYRLAIELGILNETAITDRTRIRVPKAERVELDVIVEIVESLTDSQIQLLRELMKDILYVTKGGIVVDRSSDCDELIGHGFFIADEKFYELMLRQQKRYQLIERLESAGITGFKKNMKTSDLADWIRDNVTDMSLLFDDLYVLYINAKLGGIQRKLYSYLLRRDEIDYYYDPDEDTMKEIPHGACFSTVVHMDGSTDAEMTFPDDEITALLNKHGKNRLSNS